MIWKRVHSSAVNCSAIIVGALPLLPLLGTNWWRYACIAICIAYHWIFRRQCLGNWLSGISNRQPLTLTYIAFYSAGFSTIFYTIAVPFDLLLIYVAAQYACCSLTGRTIPSILTGVWTYDPHDQSTDTFLADIQFLPASRRSNLGALDISQSDLANA